jgi:hypothetical protein
MFTKRVRLIKEAMKRSELSRGEIVWALLTISCLIALFRCLAL